MPRRRNSDLEKIRAFTNTTCPHCGTQIEPKDYERVDWEHLECPRCGKQFVPRKA
jgi:ribosomal protein S27AE